MTTEMALLIPHPPRPDEKVGTVGNKHVQVEQLMDASIGSPHTTNY
jgi:hypothetical protein